MQASGLLQIALPRPLGDSDYSCSEVCFQPILHSSQPNSLASCISTPQHQAAVLIIDMNEVLNRMQLDAYVNAAECALVKQAACNTDKMGIDGSACWQRESTINTCYSTNAQLIVIDAIISPGHLSGAIGPSRSSVLPLLILFLISYRSHCLPLLSCLVPFWGISWSSCAQP